MSTSLVAFVARHALTRTLPRLFRRRRVFPLLMARAFACGGDAQVFPLSIADVSLLGARAHA